MLDTFDAPDTAESCPRREVSTVAPQALALMNSEWMEQQAERFAARIEQIAAIRWARRGGWRWRVRPNRRNAPKRRSI